MGWPSHIHQYSKEYPTDKSTGQPDGGDFSTEAPSFQVWCLSAETSLLTWCQALASLRDFLHPGVSAAPEAAPEAAPSPHRAEPQLLSVAPSFLQSQHHLGGSYMLASLTASTSRASAPSGPQLLSLKRAFPDFTSVMLGSYNHNWVSSPSRPLSIVPTRQRFHFYRLFTQNDHTNDKCLQRTLTSQASIVGFFF